MHNLAVLDADGGGKGADYKSASQWFRKAADRGVADSRSTSAFLYARGIGVEQNLAEILQMVQPRGGRRATRTRPINATTLQSASMPSRWRRKARDPDLYPPSRSPTTPSTWRRLRAGGIQRRRKPPPPRPVPSQHRPSAPRAAR